MIKTPVDPYFVNAAMWWLDNKNSDLKQFRAWLEEQGTIIEDRSEFCPWLYFDSEVKAEIFKAKWRNEIVNNSNIGLATDKDENEESN
jgi:hypothetical protein